MTAPATDPALPWYDDLCSCLQIDIGHVLEREGWHPVQALGAGWRFRAPKGAVEPVEYYHPAGEDLEEDFCLYHPVRLRWRRSADAAEAHHDLVGALRRGTPVIVAVNNFHLPFRPAYHDVHAAHLVLVTGADEERDLYHVVDPMPPAFDGELPRAALERARDQLDVDDDSDPFFAGSRPSWRWLDVEVTGPQPALDWSWTREAIRRNTAALRESDRGPQALTGLLESLPDRVAEEGTGPLRDIYVLGWPAQAEASLHGSFLAHAARRLDRPDLADAAREVDRVAHAWTGVRVSAAHLSAEDRPDLRQASALGQRLVLAWEQCLQHLDRLVSETA